MSVITLFYVKKTYEISLMMGNTSGLLTMLHYVRTAYLFTDASVGSVLAILGFSVNAMGYVFVFIVLYNYVFFGKGYVKWIYFIPIIIYFISASMGTGRTVFIRFFATILTIGVLLWYKKKNINKLKLANVIRIFLVGVFGVAIFYAVFQLLGIFTAKTGTLSVWDMLSIYTGSSIPGLNIFLNDFIPDNHFWGSESFHSLYSTLNMVGFNLPNDTIHLEFVDFSNGYSTNIYTSLRSYIYDFGYLGMFLVQFINGVFFSLFYVNIKSRKKINYLFIIVYGYLNYGLAIQGIEEDFLRSFMSVTQIFEIFFITIFYNVLVKGKVRRMTSITNNIKYE